MKKEKSKIFYHYDWLIVALVAGAVYSSSLNADFVYDDRPAILTNDDVLGRTSWSALAITNDFWGNPIGLEGSHKSYRPLITASFRLQFGVHGAKAVWFHAVNVICHVINSILVLSIARRSGLLEHDLSLFAALLFSCHPITSEAVCSIVGRSDLLATFFVLLAIQRRLSSSSDALLEPIVLATLAVLSKETGIILLPLIGLGDVLFKNQAKQHGTRDLLLHHVMAFGAICYLRLSINNFQSPTFSKNDNPIAHDPDWLTRTLTFLYLPVFHFLLMVFPKTLSYDWSMDAIAKVETPLDSRFIGSLIFYGTLTIATWKLKNNSKFLFFLALMTTPHFISSNLLTYVGFVAAERILYLPAVGYCILLASGIQKVRSKLPFWLLILLLAMHASRTLHRVQDWETEESLFSSALLVNPTKAHMNLGYVFTQKGDFQVAIEHYRQALRRKANLADAWYNLGILTSKTSNGNVTTSSEAISYYQQAILSRSNFAAAHLNIALLLHDTGNHQKAFAHLEQCLTSSGDNLKTYRTHLKMKATCAFNKGRLLQKAERCPEAIDDFQLALRLGGAHFEHVTSVLNSLGSCYSQIGDEDRAEKYFEMAIQENHVNSFLTMAHLRIRQNRSFEVEELFDRVMKLAPESVTVLQNIALAEFHMKNYNRSLHFYRKALSIEPNHVDSVRGMASLLQETQNLPEAEKFYRKVVALKSDSYEAHANLGAILHLNRKYELALKAYDSALLLNPNDRITVTNREKLVRILKRVQSF